MKSVAKTASSTEIHNPNQEVILIEPAIEIIDLTRGNDDSYVTPKKKFKFEEAKMVGFSKTQDPVKISKKSIKSETSKQRSGFITLLTCVVCSGPALFRHPKTLEACEHAFCTACILILVESTKVCPSCQHSLKTLQSICV